MEILPPPNFRAEWQATATKVLVEVEEWRTLHPQATFDEIEVAIDQRLTRLRRQILEDSTQLKSGSTLTASSLTKCEKCESVLHKRGKHTRKLLSEGGEEITLEREYLVCPQCRVGLFPPR